MNIFKRHHVYPDGYNVIEGPRHFDEEELSMIKSAKVVQSQWGLSACFFFHSGGKAYIPLSKDCEDSVEINDILDPNHLEVVTLKRESDDSIIDRIVL